MLHPAVRILLFLCYAIALQSAEGRALALLAGLGTVSLLLPGAAVRWARLARRLRWLLLSLCLVFAYSVPGDPLLADAASSAWLPTAAGLGEAGGHAARLLALLAAVAALLASTPAAALLSGLYPLLRPLAMLGVPVERLVVRLLLTLEYVEQLAEEFSRIASVKSLFQVQVWQHLLGEGNDVEPGELAATSLVLQSQAYSWRDALALTAALLALGGCLAGGWL